jgi:hypothetical protein
MTQAHQISRTLDCQNEDAIQESDPSLSALASAGVFGIEPVVAHEAVVHRTLAGSDGCNRDTGVVEPPVDKLNRSSADLARNSHKHRSASCKNRIRPGEGKRSCR